MGTYYTLYAEAKINNVWRGINFFIESPYGKHIVPIIEGKSFVGMAMDKIGGYYPINKDELSDEVKRAESWLFNDDSSKDTLFNGWMNSCTQQFEAKQLTDLDFNKRRHAGFVATDDVLAFERGDLEYIGEWLTGKEYAQLPKDARVAYRYYEWTDVSEEEDSLRIMKNGLVDRINAFNNLYIHDEEDKCISISPSDCRIIVIIS